MALQETVTIQNLIVPFAHAPSWCGQRFRLTLSTWELPLKAKAQLLMKKTKSN